MMEAERRQHTRRADDERINDIWDEIHDINEKVSSIQINGCVHKNIHENSINEIKKDMKEMQNEIKSITKEVWKSSGLAAFIATLLVSIIVAAVKELLTK